MTSRRTGHETTARRDTAEKDTVQLELPLGREAPTRAKGATSRRRPAPGRAGRPATRTVPNGSYAPAGAPAAGVRRPAAGRSGEGGGRLDAQTRRIGRQGIAEARARLAAGAGRSTTDAGEVNGDASRGRPVQGRGAEGHAA